MVKPITTTNKVRMPIRVVKAGFLKAVREAVA